MTSPMCPSPKCQRDEWDRSQACPREHAGDPTPLSSLSSGDPGSSREVPAVPDRSPSGDWCLRQTGHTLGPKRAGAPGVLARSSFLPVRVSLHGCRWQPTPLSSLSLLQDPQHPLSGTMQALVSPGTKAIFVALFLFAILLILCVILWYICRDLYDEYIRSR